MVIKIKQLKIGNLQLPVIYKTGFILLLNIVNTSSKLFSGGCKNKKPGLLFQAIPAYNLRENIINLSLIF